MNTKIFLRIFPCIMIFALLSALLFPDTALASTLEMGQNFDAYTPPNLPSGWDGASEGWVTTNTNFYTSPNSVFRVGPDNEAVVNLVSQSFTPGGSPSMVTFNTKFEFEIYWSGACYDGGVLEISIAGGPWMDILDAGGVFERNGYSKQIATGTHNPLAGRWAWTESSGGWKQVRLRLPLAATGQSTQLRWRLGSDFRDASQGWWIDDVAVINPDVTVTTLSASANPSIYGPVTFTAAVTSGGSPVPAGYGDVTFFVNDAPIPGCSHVAVQGSGQAACSTAALHVGSYTLRAIFVGEASYMGSSTTLSPFTVTQRPLTVTATGINKVYDRQVAAQVTLSDNRLTGDVLTVSGTATYADWNVGNGKPISVSGISLTGADAENYTFNTTASTSANITPRALTVSATGIHKVYNGLVEASVTLSDNRLGGDSLAANYTAAFFDNKNVGNSKPVTVSGISLTGTDAGNYTVNTTASTSANITPRTLTISATGIHKVYNGLVEASVTLSDNRLGGDSLAANYTAAFFDNKNVGSGKPVNVFGITITGTDAGNYTNNITAATAANIIARPLTIAAAAADKVYDGAVVAAVTLSDDRVLGDALSITYTSATFADKNAGVGKIVTVSGLAVGGEAAGNYVANLTATDTADITPRFLTITATGADKVYDAMANATVALADDRLTGDLLGITYASAVFADKNVGVGKIITVSGLAVGGADAGNYTSNPSTYATARITTLAITGSVTIADKVYDGALAAAINGRMLTGVLPGDVVSLAGGAAVFADPNAGTDKPVSVVGLLLGGVDAGNYTVNAVAAATASIFPAPLAIRANNAVKLVSQPLPVFSATYSGFVNGETESALSGLLSFTTPVTATSPAGEYPLTPGGLASNNYTITYLDGILYVFNAYSVTGLVASYSAPELGSQVILTATVTTDVAGLPTPLGTVTFFDAGTPVCVDVALDGQAQASCQLTASLPLGLHMLTAQYNSSSGLSSSFAYLEQNVRAADLIVVKTASLPSVLPGAWVTYTLAYANHGAYTATHVILTDTLPIGLIAPAGQPLTWNLGNLAPGASGAVTLMAQLAPDLPNGALLWNTAEITSQAAEAVLTNNTAGVSVLVADHNHWPSVYAGEDIFDAQEGRPVAFRGEVLDPVLRAYLPGAVNAIFWDFGDGGLATGVLTPTHTYLDDGVYTATLTIVDQDGLASWDHLVVTIANLAPDMGALQEATLKPGETFSLQASFTDPGILDAHTVTIVWAPGVTETMQLASGVFSFNLAHTYLEAGAYILTVTVADSGGLSVTRTLLLQVSPGAIQHWLHLPVIFRPG